MILFVKLLLAHLLGDFLLQPNSWVTDKELRKHRSVYLYLHIVLHGLLAWALVGEGFGWYAIIIAVIHGAIDLLKLHFQTLANKRTWFLADQILHLITLIIIVLIYTNTDLRTLDVSVWLWTIGTGVLFLTTPTSILIKILISKWTPNQNDTGEDLQNAGKYIGILERLFVFGFIVGGQFTAIGFLLAAKSIFRFGDLTQARDRKLTEYVLIGTFLSFGIAIVTGLLARYVLMESATIVLAAVY
ncbi:MAG: DUF3307 domain-containing protein [Flavobacterium sp.]|nr:DUF3307 domain-containing protein [Flavobacterium sp.]